MATAAEIREKLLRLTGKANTATGASDGNLASALARLIAGYGQGGGAALASGSITMSIDKAINNQTPLVIKHQLGKTPKAFLLLADRIDRQMSNTFYGAFLCNYENGAEGGCMKSLSNTVYTYAYSEFNCVSLTDIAVGITVPNGATAWTGMTYYWIVVG